MVITMSFKHFLVEYLSNNMIYFRKYLKMTDDEKAEELSRLGIYNFNNYLRDECEIDDGYDSDDYYYYEEKYPECIKKYGKFLLDLSSGNGSGNIDDYIFYDDLPAWFYFFDAKMYKNDWLIHFTDNNPYDIIKNGFESGQTDMSKIGLTHQHNSYGNDKGYSFAYDAYEFNKYASNRNGFKYGENIILFQAPGIKVWHFGDEENQVIFWDEDAKNLMPIVEGDEGYKVVSDKTGAIIYANEDLEKVVDWVIYNFEQYRSALIGKGKSR